MEAQAAFVWTNGRVELHAVSDICLDFAIVIYPRHLESENPVRLHKPFYDFRIFKLRMLIVDILDGFQHFLHCLQVLFFIGILGLQPGHYF